MDIREVGRLDIEAITRIYNHYIVNTTISFEESPVSEPEMHARVKHVQEFGLPWLVVVIDGEIQGYAYAGQWKARSAYNLTVEPSIYFAPEAKGKGMGRLIYHALLEQLKRLGIRTVIGSIALPNDSSIALHERLGFKKVGEFTNIGFKHDRRISVGYWQLELSDYPMS
ncbi:GNAT family N-acetyltransferase [Celerinatantimonas yamalensis]|uniref:N-acetyltransferase family protein n=1 Tax=Celerinatantimonas yamalensis TaxID=559956 RepID=A0ABW9G479_9GAMM